ncbi:putative short chain oxidoreductase/dehydrogenase [Aspergillus japonicus CBS 114.51]|uniref:Putative short chain oxidoreductase/dehydrogenase n=2 Tax=Aspergillus TaxID=5052 RepID=A0A2V5GRL3_ASPV1|nr:putative short chain oxidoreductase/dehydrogenase [Aspergillus japonicus CBS 114.51]PYI13835.1 putative short chain oxidoreductase/dehydrogenase [Aspergillus violaceofuscus CBS 115571]RAH79878.1 putative short chain oxidoreductase/dehydrogenase [Aspergillus japonicus CBS 114.51]
MPTYLITGASSGLGAALADAALRAGHTVLATARNPAQATLTTHPNLTWLALDITAPSTTSTLQTALAAHPPVDVLINNAGYSLLGSIEDMTLAEVHAQFDTNVFGAIRVLQAVLPGMRARRSGTVVNISSSAGLDGLPACAVYAGSKFAMEGMSESLAKELAPLGVRVLLVEPGTLRTGFWAAFVEPAAGLNPEYQGTPVEAVLTRFRGNRTGEATGGSDPGKAAQRIVEVVDGTGLGRGKDGLLRVPLGEDCYRRFQAKVEALQQNLEQMREIAHSIGFEE